MKNNILAQASMLHFERNAVYEPKQKNSFLPKANNMHYFEWKTVFSPSE